MCESLTIIYIYICVYINIVYRDIAGMINYTTSALSQVDVGQIQILSRAARHEHLSD